MFSNLNGSCFTKAQNFKHVLHNNFYSPHNKVGVLCSGLIRNVSLVWSEGMKYNLQTKSQGRERCKKEKKRERERESKKECNFSMMRLVERLSHLFSDLVDLRFKIVGRE